MLRAKLWKPEHWPDASATAGISEAMVTHAKLSMTPEELDRLAEQEGLTRLY